MNVPASTYPFLSRLLASSGGEATTFFAVLHEDGYESTFGDGSFYYLWNVFTTKEEAELDITRTRNGRSDAYLQWGRFHLREISLALRREELILEVLEPGPYDSYTAEDVMTVLEDRHAFGYRRSKESLAWRVAWDAQWLVKLEGYEQFFCYSAEAVDRLLARATSNARVHPVSGIKEGEAGPGLSRAEWMAGKRHPDPTPASQSPSQHSLFDNPGSQER